MVSENIVTVVLYCENINLVDIESSQTTVHQIEFRIVTQITIE